MDITVLALIMSEEWDCYVPSEDEWAELEPGAFEVLGNIKSQSAISTKALAECLHRLKMPVGTAQQSKSTLASSIASAVLVHPDWSQASTAMVHLAQVGTEKADLSAALFAVDFWLDANTPVQHPWMWRHQPCLSTGSPWPLLT